MKNIQDGISVSSDERKQTSYLSLVFLYSLKFSCLMSMTE